MRPNEGANSTAVGYQALLTTLDKPPVNSYIYYFGGPLSKVNYNDVLDDTDYITRIKHVPLLV
jgi:hypothetical protein